MRVLFFKMKPSWLLWSNANGEFMDVKMEILARCPNISFSVYSVWRVDVKLTWSHSSWLHKILTQANYSCANLGVLFEGILMWPSTIMALCSDATVLGCHCQVGWACECFPFGGPCTFPTLQRPGSRLPRCSFSFVNGGAWRKDKSVN